MVKILDHRGNPIDTSILKTPQTEEQLSKLGSMAHEFADHPSRGLTPPKLANILQEAEQGDLIAQCDLYDDIEEKDGHVFAEMSKRKRALLNLDWDIEPPRNATPAEEKATELIRELISDITDFEDVQMNMLDGIGKGYSCQELEWGRSGKYWVPDQVHFRQQRWFTVHQDNRDELRLRGYDTNGEALQPFGWLVHKHRARTGYVTRSGLVRVLAWPFLFKNYSVRDLAEFLEIYGLPVRLGTYPSGSSHAEKMTLLRAVVGIGHNAAGIIPEGMAVDFKEAATGRSDPYMVMMNWCERTQSKAILGGTLTSQTDSGSGAYALGNVHLDVMRDLTVSDAKQIASTMTRDLIWPLAALNTSVINNPRRCPIFKYDTKEPEDLKIRADRDKVLFDMGYRLKPDAVEKVYGDEYEPVPDKTPLEESTTAAARGKVPGSDTDTVDQQLARLNDEGAGAIGDILDKMQALLDEVDSLEEFRDRLLEAYPDMPTEQLTDVMQHGMVAASMAGRFEIGA